MTTVGLGLVVVGIALFGVAMIGASTDRTRGLDEGAFKALEWLWAQLKIPMQNLTRAGLKWYRRVVALGQICLLVGLFLVALDVASGDDSDGGGSSTTSSSTTSSTN